jgi:hypothetical protein
MQMAGEALRPSEKTCVDSPITSRERVEALLVEAHSNFPFFWYRSIWISKTWNFRAPKHTLSSALTLTLKYITQNQDAFLQEKFFFFSTEADYFGHVSGLQYEDTFFSYLLQTNFQAFI